MGDFNAKLEIDNGTVYQKLSRNGRYLIDQIRMYSILDSFFELEPESWVNLDTGDSYLVEDYPFGKTANVVSGIANPNRFLKTLNSLNFIWQFSPQSCDATESLRANMPIS